jgi:hypothetical protein
VEGGGERERVSIRAHHTELPREGDTGGVCPQHGEGGKCLFMIAHSQQGMGIEEGGGGEDIHKCR